MKTHTTNMALLRWILERKLVTLLLLLFYEVYFQMLIDMAVTYNPGVDEGPWILVALGPLCQYFGFSNENAAQEQCSD